MEYYSPRGFKLLPPVVKNLLIINVLFFFATVVLERTYGIDLAKYLGLFFFKGENFHFYQYITYMFMHGSFSHLFFNMFALWMFGYTLENIWGSKRFLMFFLITGLGAALTHTIVQGIEYYSIQNAINQYAQNPDVDGFIALITSKFNNYNPAVLEQFTNEWRMSSMQHSYAGQSLDLAQKLLVSTANIPTVGASGSVYGILLAFGMMFPNALIYIYFLFPVKVKWFVIAYGVIEIFSAIAYTNDGIAHFAHLGGMIFGFFLIRHWRKNSFTRWD